MGESLSLGPLLSVHTNHRHWDLERHGAKTARRRCIPSLFLYGAWCIVVYCCGVSFLTRDCLYLLVTSMHCHTLQAPCAVMNISWLPSIKTDSFTPVTALMLEPGGRARADVHVGGGGFSFFVFSCYATRNNNIVFQHWIPGNSVNVCSTQTWLSGPMEMIRAWQTTTNTLKHPNKHTDAFKRGSRCVQSVYTRHTECGH